MRSPDIKLMPIICGILLGLVAGYAQPLTGQTTHEAAAVRGPGHYVVFDYPASTAEGELQIAVTFTLWIPDGVKTLRGIIVHQHGAGTTAANEGATAAYDLHWQALAKKWDCALLGPSYHVTTEKLDWTPGGSKWWFDPTKGSEKAFLKALGDLAAKSGHPEVATVPWALWGHSGGGIWADIMTAMHPDRVVAVWLRSGAGAMLYQSQPATPPHEVPAAVFGIPIMGNPGIKELGTWEWGAWQGPLKTFKEYRARGGLIGFAPDPRTGHECGGSRYMAIPYLDACLAARLPDKGSKSQTPKPMDTRHAWLAPLLGDTAEPAAHYKGNPLEAVWLPNAAVAKAWMEYVRTGTTSDSTPPPAPYDVKAAGKGNEGTEITWNADADFESGIGYFLILRDGTQAGKVGPIEGKYGGRPVFQGMGFHDTPPDKPLPQMRYTDASAKAGETHTYAVITVNSAGLKSEPASAQPAAAPALATAAEIIIDNSDPRFKGVGDWASATGGHDYKDEVVWATAAGATDTPATATWTPDIKVAGQYDVYEWHGDDPNSDHASNAPFTIKFDGGTKTVLVNLRANTGRWNLLGTFTFAAGTAGNVTLTSKADGNVIADAVKFAPHL